MIEPFNESSMMTIVDEILKTETLDHLSIEDQMMVIDLVCDCLKRYKGLETKHFLDEIDEEYQKKKENYRYNLSDL